MIAAAICLTASLAAPEIPVRAGTPIAFDGRVESGEWDDAFSVTRPYADGKKLTFFLKRNGPWLALGLRGDRAYVGEVVRIYVADGAGAWITNMLLGLGQPAMPPALWRRSTTMLFHRGNLGPGQCPRACRTRLDIGSPDRWSAEVLIRLAAFGIGRDDRRSFRAMFAVTAGVPEPKTLLMLPGGIENRLDVAKYGRLVSPDGWGKDERWAPVSADLSREFDDHELLYRLFLEHDRVSVRDPTEELVISSAVLPRSMTRIGLLRDELDAGRKRNPTLTAWTYFTGRLLHEANLYGEARRVVESVPRHLLGLEALTSLTAEHYLDTQEWQKSLDVCKSHPFMREGAETVKLALNGLRAWGREQKALARDREKSEKNPRVRLVTTRGIIVCELFEDDAPFAVYNFVDLVLRRKYYDGLRFHEVAGGQAAVVGDPRTRPGGGGDLDGPPWRLKRDAASRPLLRGYLACVPARGDVNHGSHFFITVAPLMKESPHLTVFGRVLEGQDVVDSLEQDDTLGQVEMISRRNHPYDALKARLGN